ncbi:MAG: HsdM family class I SAM-dependent methyltransferase, partial [Thermoguttaceae bacterium]
QSSNCVKFILKTFGPKSAVAGKFLNDAAFSHDSSNCLPLIQRYFVAVVVGTLKRWFPDNESVNSELFIRQYCFEQLGEIEIPDEFFRELPAPDEITDYFGQLYQSLIPAQLRKKLGEFYTPGWLADMLVETATQGFESANSEAGQEKNLPIPILDPACGSGVFLLAAVRKLKKLGLSNETILQNIAGFDLNPIAVLTARANLAVALFSDIPNNYTAVRKTGSFTKAELSNFCINDISVYECNSLWPDSFTHQNSENVNGKKTDSFKKRFSLIVGNPPWINWDRFSEQEKADVTDLLKEYGLFNLTGKEARYGGAKKEFAALMLLRAADLYLKDGGKIALVVPQPMFQTNKSGSGLRKFFIEPANMPLKVLRVDDFSSIHVFSGVNTKASTILLRKGEATTFPVQYFRWSRDTNHDVNIGSNREVNHDMRCEENYAKPIDSDDTASSWQIQPFKPLDSPKRCVKLVKFTNLRAYLGANTGGANGVFWVEVLKQTANGNILIRN